MYVSIELYDFRFTILSIWGNLTIGFEEVANFTDYEYSLVCQASNIYPIIL